MAEFRCTVVTDPERSEQTIFLKYQEELFAHFEIAFSSKVFPFGEKERREGASLVSFPRPSSSLARPTSFPRVQVAPPHCFVGHNARDWNARHAEQMLARASKENEPLASVGFQTSCLKTYQRYTFFFSSHSRREINLDKKRSSLVFSFKRTEKESSNLE